MKCPKCGNETTVKDSRKKHDSVIRRRECKCGERFSTKEVIVVLSNYVRKQKPVNAISMSQTMTGGWNITIDENTPEWAKKMLINL